MGPYAVVDYNLTLNRLWSRLQHIYHGQPYARVDLNPTPELTLTLCQSHLYPPVRDVGFGLSIVPDWKMTPAMAAGCRTGPPSYIGWRAGTTNPPP
jgi:hypothetical protein